MVNLLAVKMIVLIIVTNCYIVDFQYALFVSSHWNCLFLSYCSTLMHINSLQQRANRCPAFCPNTTTSPWLYGAFIVFLGSTRCIQGTGFSLYHYRACSLYNFLCELHLWTHYMENFTKGTLSIWDISFHVYLYLNCRHISLKS